jgi:hypothetical protein
VRYQFGAGDIFGLGRLVATAKQDNNYSVAPCDVRAD